MFGRILIAMIAGAFVCNPSLTQQPADTKAANDRFAMIFGPNAAELKFPLRTWIPKIGMVIAATEFKVDTNGHIVLSGPVSIGIVGKEPQILRGERAIIVANEAIRFSDIANAHITHMEVLNKETTIILLGSEPNFRFKIAKDAPVRSLLPGAPAKAAVPPPLNEDLTKVPELIFDEPISKNLMKFQAMETIAHRLAKANHLNTRKTDGFVKALIAERADLRGLPFLMGEDCRTREDQATTFAFVAIGVNRTLANAKNGAPGEPTEFWKQLSQANHLNAINGGNFGDKAAPQLSPEPFNRALVAAAMQILMPESAQFRAGLAKFLATVPHADATRALARLALYSAEEDVRAAAIKGLKLRRDQDYTEIMLDGFRYPLPAVSRRAAEALVKLERKDLVANLVEVLERPDPRLPVKAMIDGKEVTVVLELVKVNHHRNCMLCHAPGNTEDVPEGVLKVAVPLPNEPLPKPSQGGYQSTPSPDVTVRIDMTYLRQDFSLMMPVADAHPWPEMQRFDFLARTREVTPDEARAYTAAAVTEPGRLSPYHRSALFALRELTGRDAAPTAEAWRKLLKLHAN